MNFEESGSMGARPDASEEFVFRFNGRRITALAGDTIASALYRSGLRIFSRSFKYHRPRGLLCLTGDCPNCMMQVDGVPNVRTCVTRARQGMQVRHQNAWPSLSWDILSMLDRLHWLLPVGFYYKAFFRPRQAWNFYESFIRRIAGIGRLQSKAGTRHTKHKQYLHADVAVVGGGPSGLSAALEAAAAGASVTLVERDTQLGGRLQYQQQAVEAPGNRRQPAYRLAQQLAQQIADKQNIHALTEAQAFGWYPDNLLGVLQANRPIELRAKVIVVATGGYSKPLLFSNNDLPGVFLGPGLLRLVNLFGLSAGQRVLIVSNNDAGLELAAELLRAGVHIVGVVERRHRLPSATESEAMHHLQAADAHLWPGWRLMKVNGVKRVKSAAIVQVDAGGEPIGGSERTIRCDAIGLEVGYAPANELLYQSGSQLQYEPLTGTYFPSQCASGVLAAGRVAGFAAIADSIASGQRAGVEAARRAIGGGTVDSVTAIRERGDGIAEGSITISDIAHPTRPFRGGKRCFICYCEDVTLKDVIHAIDEGFDDIEILKRYSTVTMGPCQGKLCGLNNMHVLAQEEGLHPAAVGTTTARPPVSPIRLGDLAEGDRLPTRRPPLFHTHRALGATFFNSGEWLRPEFYGDPAEEARAVRESVGLIDISTLGKLEVKGKEVERFLEQLYAGNMASLPIGMTRYGLLCTEEGVVLDDSVVGRLAEDHYYITTSTARITSVEAWFRWWLSRWRLKVAVTNVTDGFAAVNVAGPQARTTLVSLTPLDLASSTFPYLGLRRTTVADAPAIVMRTGFVGELAYEIHVVADYAPYLWERLMEAGRDYHVTPCGAEAQQILRLEKGHLVVGQDTDRFTTPFEARLEWAVNLSKSEFVGKRSLEVAAARAPRRRLVGFMMNSTQPVPQEGCQVVDGEVSIGRVTSARLSPTLQRPIGLAWVPVEKAKPEGEVCIRLQDKLEPARIVNGPFYDPDGKRIRT